MLKTAIKKLIPKSFLFAYHKVLAIAANIIYWFPSRKMVVIGVTGTKGKSSTCAMLVRILENTGYVIGSTNTIFFKIGKKEWPNATKQGMPGRFKMQKILRKMSNEGCTHAVVEVTSEGIAQSRHWGIAFNMAIFTNLSPEHIESHGSYEKYRDAKETIFKNLRNDKSKSAIIVNFDDKWAKIFLRNKADEKWITSLDTKKCDFAKEENYKCLCSDKINISEDGVEFYIEGKLIKMKMHGEFMISNALLAIAASRSLGISFENCQVALENLKLPGRVEIIESKNGFKVIIDYAHEPRSFNAIFETVKNLSRGGKIISVFGATGGGRDKEKRPKMGAIASKYSDKIILTTDDPYDDDPLKLAQDILDGISEKEKAQIIVDRKEAIEKAISTAGKGDIVLILGKGSEQTMAVSGGKYIQWNDKSVVAEFLNK